MNQIGHKQFALILQLHSQTKPRVAPDRLVWVAAWAKRPLTAFINLKQAQARYTGGLGRQWQKRMASFDLEILSDCVQQSGADKVHTGGGLCTQWRSRMASFDGTFPLWLLARQQSRTFMPTGNPFREWNSNWLYFIYIYIYLFYFLKFIYRKLNSLLQDSNT